VQGTTRGAFHPGTRWLRGPIDAAGGGGVREPPSTGS